MSDTKIGSLLLFIYGGMISRLLTNKGQLSGEGRAGAEGRGAGRLRAARWYTEVRRVLRATHTRDPRRSLM